MNVRINWIAVIGALWVASTLGAYALESRIKDVARIAGLEPVELIGYGVVVGLSGTGDKDLKVTKQTMANLLENFQISIPITDIKSKNSAAVMVTARVPPFHTAGDKIDITVASIGDSSSLQGGVLMMTPLLDPQGGLYALAQGPITVGGYNVGSRGTGGESVSKNVTTVGIIPNGGMLKYGRTGNYYENGIMKLVLLRPDFTTAERVARAINTTMNCGAIAKDAGTISVAIPQNMLDTDQVANFVSKLEILPVKPDMVAKVIVNERTGTIVMGNEVRIAPAVVAHGALIVSIKSTPIVSQPTAPFADGKTVVVPDETTRVQEDKAKIVAIQETTTVQELTQMLSGLGATTSDLISILEALSRLGALQMEMVTM